MPQLEERKVQAYIKRFEKVAKVEMEKFGIPASIKMAQGIIESQANAHPNALSMNNHFGQPMATQRYESAWENWRAHSLMISNSKLKDLCGNKSVKQWAKALQKSGYSTIPNYANELLEVIDTYELNRLDR